MERLAISDLLRALPFLRRLAPDRLDRLVSESEVRRFAPGERLMSEGDRGEDVFFLLSGSVAVRKRRGGAEGRPTRGAEEATLAVRRSGDCVGELALLDGKPRSASVAALEPVASLCVPRQTFLAAVGAEPEAAGELLRALGRRLRESDRALVESLAAKARGLAAESGELVEESRRPSERLDARGGFASFVGESAAACRVRELARRAARSDLPVLLLGETGTGKEVLARAIHAASSRAPRRFVAVNCALLSETLLESELFGHARGAFTGAREAKPGLVEVASGGTLLLDEVAELPWSIQAALLRFLELGECRRLGDTHVRHADVRVMAATHADLDRLVGEGGFRRDLLYRLDVIRVELPALRERPDDVERLLRHASERVARRLRRPLLRFSSDALDRLRAHAFPGNVRELENEVERLYASLEDGGCVEPNDFSPRLRESTSSAQGSYGEALRAFKVQVLRRTLRECGGSQAEAARALGVHPSNLARMLRELGLRAARVKPAAE